MRQSRISSTMLACAVHENMDPNNYLQFDKIRDFPPPAISLEVWRELCKRSICFKLLEDAFAKFQLILDIMLSIVGTQKVGLTSPRMGQKTVGALIVVASHRDTRVDQWDMLSVVPVW
ncbi:hypothetical protein Hanom_Chr05g00405401 [Helianthus anomalus]